MKRIIIACLSLLVLTACQQKAQVAQNNMAEESAVETDTAESTLQEGYEVGNKYVDFEMAALQGNTIRLSDYVANNRYTLVDFWASWCGPCRAEMPTVVKAYTEFHGKGLEIIGVSLDNERSAWAGAVEQLNMAWPQMSDLKGWDCSGAALYNVRSIPSNVLIDQQGKIVAKDLRGVGLLDKLAELL